ncbi:MAG: hypothetical protein EOP48_34235, partial [Sphingobacteriales bacterium]
MSNLSPRGTLHNRMCHFMDWIKPDPNKRDSDCEQAANVRKNVKQNAEEEGMTVTSTPSGGSDEKNTGLRRHYRGNSEVDGYDIDIPIVIKPANSDGEAFEELLKKFEKLVAKSYPNSKIKPTNSSIELTFSNELRFDIVPMLSTDKSDEQIILRKDGNKVQTSVQKHNEFIKKRTKQSKEHAGRVTFNDCIRAMKWWREFQAYNSYYLSYDETTGKDNRPP